MTRHVVAGDVSIAYSDTGSGEPMVLIHGGESGRTQYEAFAPLLGAGIRAIAYDQRDTGESAPRRPTASRTSPLTARPSSVDSATNALTCSAPRSAAPSHSSSRSATPESCRHSPWVRPSPRSG